MIPLIVVGALLVQESRVESLANWDLDGTGGWNVRGDVLVLEKPGVPGGPIRRPAALAISRGKPLDDLELQVEVRSTAPTDLAVRDVLLIFGYQSPSRFYYVHLSARTDAVHNGIFLVDHADRRRIDDGKAPARLTDQAWHRVRLVRQTATGSIQVFFGDETTPTLSAVDRTLLSGRVGVGSFDETGEFRGFHVRPAAQQPTQLPRGQMPDLGRHTRHDDEIPLFDFDAYFVGKWTFVWDMPEGPLGAAGRVEGTTVYRPAGPGVYEASTEATGPSGKIAVKELIRYHREQKTLSREVTDSRGFTYNQTGTIGGDLGGLYTIYFESAPFVVNGQSVRLRHTMRLTSPLNYRVSTTVSVGDGPFRNYGTPWWRKEM